MTMMQIYLNAPGGGGGGGGGTVSMSSCEYPSYEFQCHVCQIIKFINNHIKFTFQVPMCGDSCLASCNLLHYWQ